MLVLFLFVVFLASQGVVFGQAFNPVADSSVYPQAVSGAIIPQKPNQAILAWRREPRGGVIVSVDIVPSVTFGAGNNAPGYITSFGWAYSEGAVGESGYDIFYTICDASTLYLRSGSLSSYTLNFIQKELERKNLGTVKERQIYINSFWAGPPSLIDLTSIFDSFKALLGPWLYVGLSLALGIFCLDLGFSLNKQTIGKAEKVARAQIRKEIRNDPGAKIMRSDMALLYSISKGALGADRATRRRARREFEKAAARYEEYKKKNGWIL